ncbi:unnamed protein product [Musa banksii]
MKLCRRCEEEVVPEEVEEALHGPAGLRCRRGRRRRSGWPRGEQRRAAERATEVLVVVEPPVQAAMVEHVPAVPQLPHAVLPPHLAQAHRARRCCCCCVGGGRLFLLSYQLGVGRDVEALPHRPGRGAVTSFGLGDGAVFRRGGNSSSRPPAVGGKEQPLDHETQEESGLFNELNQHKSQVAVLYGSAHSTECCQWQRKKTNKEQVKTLMEVLRGG